MPRGGPTSSMQWLASVRSRVNQREGAVWRSQPTVGRKRRGRQTAAAEGIPPSTDGSDSRRARRGPAGRWRPRMAPAGTYIGITAGGGGIDLRFGIHYRSFVSLLFSVERGSSMPACGVGARHVVHRERTHASTGLRTAPSALKHKTSVPAVFPGTRSMKTEAYRDRAFHRSCAVLAVHGRGSGYVSGPTR